MRIAFPSAFAGARLALGPALVVGVVAFVLTVEWRAQGRAQEEVRERREELASIVGARQRTIDRLEDRLAELHARVDHIAERSGERELQRLRDQAAELTALSGGAPVTGAGLIVDLSDAPDARRSDPADTDFLIQDVDLQSVVNALWASGAEAVAVNGQRIVSTTAIRNAGAVIRLNYKVLTSPFRVEAIGDPGDLRRRFEASAIARRFGDWTQIYGLGYDVSEADELRVPAYTGTLRFAHARPVRDAKR